MSCYLIPLHGSLKIMGLIWQYPSVLKWHIVLGYMVKVKSLNWHIKCLWWIAFVMLSLKRLIGTYNFPKIHLFHALSHIINGATSWGSLGVSGLTTLNPFTTLIQLSGYRYMCHLSATTLLIAHSPNPLQLFRPLYSSHKQFPVHQILQSSIKKEEIQ